MVLERMLWNFDFILYKIVFNYPELQFLETFYQGAKHFPEDSYFTTSINLNFLTRLSTPSQIQLCQRSVTLMSAPPSPVLST